jgi:hypothetical protein
MVPPGKSLSELADYRKKSTGTAMFLDAKAKHKVGYWVTPKGAIQVAQEGKKSL